MMALAIFLLSFWVLSIPVWAACIGSSPSLTAPTWADVAACHTAANNGDTITVTNGSYTVSTTTTITKYVILKAQSALGVVITDNVPNVNDLLAIVESTVGSTRVEGFKFVQGTGVHDNPSALIAVSHLTGGKPVLLTGTRYEVGTSGDYINWTSNRGVVWDNEIVGIRADPNCSSNAAFLRHKPSGLITSWTTPAKFGSADINGDENLYVEGNILSNVAEALDCDSYCRMVMRHNTLTNAIVFNHGDSSISGRYVEVYDNTWVFDQRTWPGCADLCPANVNGWMGARGGTQLVIRNVIPDITYTGQGAACWGSADRSEILLKVDNLRRNVGGYACYTGGYPAPYQTGWGYSTGATQADATGVFQDLEPYYFAANTGAGGSDGNYTSPTVADYSCVDTGSTGSCDSPSSPPNAACLARASALTYVVANREYYAQNASFNGTSGTGFGLRASRPASSTNGVAYWATDQGGNWDSSNGSANDGCLDKVISGAWVNCWYTPYTYPHPLASGGIPVTTPTTMAVPARLTIR